MKQVADKVDQEIMPLLRKSKTTRELLAAQAKALEQILGLENAPPAPIAVQKDSANGAG